MSNYKQLIQKIFNSNDSNTVDSIKKLIYLTVNDSQNFSPFAAKIAKLIGQSLNQVDDDQIKKNLLQLLSQITTNYFQHIPTNYYNFSALINLLSDENAEVRKASHYLLLIFIKKYEKIDEVIESYLKTITQNPDHWKIIQKIIHSFQSLLVIQPRCITYGKKYESMDQFMKILLAFRAHQHHLIQKASDQTVSSFVKNQYAPQVLPKLDGKIISQLINYASKLNFKLSVNKQAIGMLNIGNEQEELEQIKISGNNVKKSKKRIVLEQLLKNIQSENDWKVKLQAVQSISNELNVCNENQIPIDLIDKCLDLTYDYNFKTCITSMNCVLTLVSKFSNTIQHKKDQLEDIIIEKVCDLKMAVRQIACKILKKLYESPNKSFNKKLLVKLSNCSVVGKQQILNFLQQNYSGAESNDLAQVLTDVSSQLMNDNTRIKIKTIDCIVKLSMSNDIEQCKQILQKKLNKVYYDMFLERLKEKNNLEKSENLWDNDKNFNKGMTWQAQRSAPIQNVDKQNFTKVQFGVRKAQKSNMIDTIEDFSYQKPPKKIESTIEKKNTLKSISNKTANTFDTFQSEDSNSYKLTKKNLSSKQGSSFLSQQTDFKVDIQQKKAPLKPNPIKKKVIENNSIQKEDELVIQSKQYLTKNNDEQRPPIRQSMKMNKNSMEESSSMAKTIPKQPFSIKKSSSINKKQHQIDYKATYYTAKEELASLDNPNASIKEIIFSLPKDNDWNKQFEALNLIRRFIKNHQDIYSLFYENLSAIMPEVLKLIESLRSTLAKNAMITLSQMCEALEKAMDPFIEPIFVKLFKKAQDANSFIVEQVKKCVSSLCHYCSTAKIASIISMNCQTKAIPVKIKVAICTDKLLEKKDYHVDTLKQNPKLLGIMNNLIADSSVQVRNIIKETFECICKQNQKAQIEDVFKKNCSKQSWEKFKKILEKEGKNSNF